MSRRDNKPKFSHGDGVRVRHGVTDPDFPDVPIGGWAGEVAEIQYRNPLLYLVRWNQRTLGNMHPVYRKRCERDGLDCEEMLLGEDDLEPDTGEPLEIEQPTQIQTRPLDMANQDDRIRAVFGLTSDDPLPEMDLDTLRTCRDYLAHSRSKRAGSRNPARSPAGDRRSPSPAWEIPTRRGVSTTRTA